MGEKEHKSINPTYIREKVQNIIDSQLLHFGFVFHAYEALSNYFFTVIEKERVDYWRKIFFISEIFLAHFRFEWVEAGSVVLEHISFDLDTDCFFVTNVAKFSVDWHGKLFLDEAVNVFHVN